MMDNPLTDPDQFLQWRDHPLTQAFHQFLRDRIKATADLWLAETSPSAMMQADQTRAGTLLDLADLSVDDVRQFYGMEAASE